MMGLALGTYAPNQEIDSAVDQLENYTPKIPQLLHTPQLL